MPLAMLSLPAVTQCCAARALSLPPVGGRGCGCPAGREPVPLPLLLWRARVHVHALVSEHPSVWYVPCVSVRFPHAGWKDVVLTTRTGHPREGVCPSGGLSCMAQPTTRAVEASHPCHGMWRDSLQRQGWWGVSCHPLRPRVARKASEANPHCSHQFLGLLFSPPFVGDGRWWLPLGTHWTGRSLFPGIPWFE